jgi:hypothetical protein
MKTKLLLFASLALLLTCVISTFAQLPPEARVGLWKAQWINSPSAPLRESVVLHFRKVIEISQVPEHFVVNVSADSLFILDVNQREVGRGPARSDLAHWKYEIYDLAAFLHSGRNEITATVWSCFCELRIRLFASPHLYHQRRGTDPASADAQETTFSEDR